MIVDKLLTYYLAGPMSGIPRFNIPMFDSAAISLRNMGYNIVSPAELDSPEMRALALASIDGDLSELEKDTDETWGNVLARDVHMVADKVDGIIFLPNWWESRGAKLEAFVGLLTRKQFGSFHPAGFYDIQNDCLYNVTSVTPLDREIVKNVLRRFMP